MKRFLIALVLTFMATTALAAPPPFIFATNPALLLPTGCTNGQSATYTAATNRWSCAAAGGDFLADGSVPMTGILNAALGIYTKNGATSPGFIDFFEDSSNGTSYARLYGPVALAGNISWTLPDTALARGSFMTGSSTANTFGWLTVGAAGKIITTDGTDPAWSAYTVAAPGAANAFLTSNGTNWVRTASSANMLSLLGSADYDTARTNLGLKIGTNVQAYDAELASLSTMFATGTNTFSITNGTASLDIAAGAALNIDTSLQITTGAVVIAGQAGGSSVTFPSTGTLLAADGAGASLTGLQFDQFVTQTAWRVFYSNADGDVTELALGASGKVLKSNGADAAPTWEDDNNTGSATALDDIADPDAATSISLGDDEGITIESAEDTGTILLLKSTDADLAGATSILDLSFNDDGQANGYFIRGYDNSYTDLKWSIGANGAFAAGSLTVGGVALTLGTALTTGTGAVTLTGDAGGSTLVLPAGSVTIPATPGDVTGVGDCTGGACLDGSSDGGTYIALYDGDSHKTTLYAGNSAGDIAFYLPPTAGATGGMPYYSEANKLANLAAGTAGYILKMGATIPEWTNSLSVSAISSGGIVLGDTTPDADGEVGYASNAYLFFANSEDFKITASGNMWTFDSNTSAAFTITPALTVTGAVVASTSVDTPFLIVGSAATAADAGAIRMPNAAYIMAEADAASDDISVIGVDSSEVVQIGASGASGVTITPNTTITGDLTVSGADVTIGTGIKVTGGAGVATFTDLAGTSEVLAIDLRTENTAKLTTSSGVTAINTGALNFITTGSISGAIPIQADADGRELTAAECYGYLHVATGAGTWLLPAAAAGMNLCVLVTTNNDVIIDIDGSDDITLVGVQDTDGDGITNATGSSTGDFVCLVAIDETHWYVMGKQGTWTAQ